jgi:hypothetical protein
LVPGRSAFRLPPMADERRAAGGEEPGVLGNLPRSRPGQRSDKRAAGEKRRGTTARSTQRRAPRRPVKRAEAIPPRGSDPVGDVLRGVGQVAEAGLTVAAGVTREVLRRLPRP